LLNKLELPKKVLSQLTTKLVVKYYTRVMVERPSAMREYKDNNRYSLFAIFCYHRKRLLIDSLVDLFIKLTMMLRTKSEKFVDDKILSEVKRVNGKFDILYTLSSSALSNPRGIIEETIYPSVGRDTLIDLVKELNCRGNWYQTQVHTKMRSFYSHAYRKMLLLLLDTLVMKVSRRDNESLLNAVELIKTYRAHSGEYYPSDLDIPIDGVITREWIQMVVEPFGSTVKIRKANYELAVLQELNKRINCKMVWIMGAYRYRDPDEDLPKDFEENRKHYYSLLELPLNSFEFINPLKDKLHYSLQELNNTIVNNKKVEILNKDNGHIKISPATPQAEPKNIHSLHQAIKKQYGTINLIDVLKEVDLQINFTDLMQTVATKEVIPRETLRRRLLLCIYGIGTNTGLKCISSANDSVTLDDLRYVKRRFITVENIRLAITEIVNKVLEIRDPRIWGTASTSVICDSKKLSVWDQNLMVEWHVRYRGRGVMVYWHVDKNALCVFSQLKTCSSSEIGSMIKGILQHCTNMEIDKAYMDTHGQSTLAFGASELLKIELLPRLKNIYAQKLFYPSSSHKSQYENLQLILKEPINWKLIEENYDEVIKHLAALKTGLVEPDVFVKRFSHDNFQHPVYRALIEIGKASRTIFLCKYLQSETLRIEIHEAQNVVERLNSIMGFIFYGKLGEISTNIKDQQELAIVCLHLLQACMAYANTQIVQNVLSKLEWQNVLTIEDYRALNILFHSHINPYGLFPLDLKKRLPLTAKAVNNKNYMNKTTNLSHLTEINRDLEVV
jgi:TnpA family transposase